MKQGSIITDTHTSLSPWQDDTLFSEALATFEGQADTAMAPPPDPPQQPQTDPVPPSQEPPSGPRKRTSKSAALPQPQPIEATVTQLEVSFEGWHKQWESGPQAHQAVFPAILTPRRGVDKQVVRLMRDRTEGNTMVKAMVLGTLAEHSLPFIMAPVIVNLARKLAEDKVALSRMKLSRTTAQYKMVHGLGKTFSDRILRNTGKLPFSVNLDEATSSSDKKVLSILVSYYNPMRKAVDVEHLGSFELVKVNAAILENALDRFFKDNDIPWSNLVLYFGFMNKEDKALYKEPWEQLNAAHHVSEKAQRHIQSFHKDLSGKGMTQQGRDRKQRLVKKLWHEDTKTELHLGVYTGVLAVLKEYVMAFQSRDTLVHKLHDKQLQVFTNFLACFVKPEHLPPIPGPWQVSNSRETNCCLQETCMWVEWQIDSDGSILNTIC
ncbi:unnamed protein product [Boreogadus saida]